MFKQFFVLIVSLLQALFFGYAMEETLADKAARTLLSSPAHLKQIPHNTNQAIKNILAAALARNYYPLPLAAQESDISYEGVCVLEGATQGEQVIAVDCNGKLVRCADQQLKDCKEWRTHTDPSASLWDQNNNVLLLGQRNGLITVVNPVKQEIIKHFATQVEQGWNQIESLSLQANVLVSAAHDGVVKLWDANYQQKTEIPLSQTVKSAYLTQLNKLMCARRDGKVYELDPETGTPIATFIVQPGTLSRMKLLKDPHLALVAHCNRVSAFDTRQARNLFSIPAHDGPMTALEILNPDYFATGAFDKTIKVWDIRLLQKAADLADHTQWIQSLSHNREYLYSGSRDTTVRSWDTQSLEQLRAPDVVPPALRILSGFPE